MQNSVSATPTSFKNSSSRSKTSSIMGTPKTTTSTAASESVMVPTPSKRRRGRPKILKDYVNPMKSPMANTSLKVQKIGYQEAKPFMKVGSSVIISNSSSHSNTGSQPCTTNKTKNIEKSLHQPSGGNTKRKTNNTNNMESPCRYKANGDSAECSGVMSRRSSATVISPFTTPQRFNYYMSSSNSRSFHSADRNISNIILTPTENGSAKSTHSSKKSPNKKAHTPSKLVLKNGSPLRIVNQTKSFKSPTNLSPSSNKSAKTKSPRLYRSNRNSLRRENPLLPNIVELYHSNPSISSTPSSSSSSMNSLHNVSSVIHEDSETTPDDGNFVFKLKIDSTGKAFIASPMETKFSIPNFPQTDSQNGCANTSTNSSFVSEKARNTNTGLLPQCSQNSKNINNKNIQPLKNNSSVGIAIGIDDSQGQLAKNKERVLLLMNKMKKKKSKITVIPEKSIDSVPTTTSSQEPTEVKVSDQESPHAKPKTSPALLNIFAPSTNLQHDLGKINPPPRVATPPQKTSAGTGFLADGDISPKSMENKFQDLTKTPLYYKDWQSQSLMMSNGKDPQTLLKNGVMDYTSSSNNDGSSFGTFKPDALLNTDLSFKNNNPHSTISDSHNILDEEEYKKFLNSSPLGVSALNNANSHMLAFNLDNLLASPTTNSFLSAFSQAVNSSPLAISKLRAASTSKQVTRAHNTQLHDIDEKSENDTVNITPNQTEPDHLRLSKSLNFDETINANNNAKSKSDNQFFSSQTRKSIYDMEFMSPSHLKNPW